MADYSILKLNGKYPIYLRVRVGKKETKVSANLEVREEEWNPKKKNPCVTYCDP